LPETEIVDKLLNRLEEKEQELVNSKESVKYCRRTLRDNSGEFEILSKEFEVPLEIEGVAISKGTWNGIYYEPEELERGADSLVGVPITADHPFDPDEGEIIQVMDEVGEVTDAEYKGGKIEFEGEIIDEGVARRVYHNLVDTCSIGTKREIEEVGGKKKATELDFIELSLVTNPACDDAKVEVLSQALDVNNSHTRKKQKEGRNNMSESSEEAELTGIVLEKEKAEEIVEEEGLEEVEEGRGYCPKKGYYPYYPYEYPNKQEDESGEKGSLEERLNSIEETIESLEEAVEDLLSKKGETEEEEKEETSDESEETEEESESEERVEELEERVEELESKPDRKSEESGGEGEQLSEEELNEATFEWLKSQH